MIWQLCLIAILFRETVQLTATVSQDAMDRCHRGLRDKRPRCGEYANLEKREVREANRRVVRDSHLEEGAPPNCDDFKSTDYYITCVSCRDGDITGDECKPPAMEEEVVDYPVLDTDTCITNMAWGDGKANTEDNNFGNCMETKEDDTYRYITSNNVPDFYVNPYCPIGLGKGYCVQQEIDADTCFFSGLTCGDDDNGLGTIAYGDVWVAQEDSYKIRLEGNPTQQDRPGDMYDARLVGGAKTNGAAQGVAINGIGILGPNDAGDVSIDDAGFQLACGGHVTPPMGNDETEGDVPSGPPKYHFHKAPDCLSPFTDAAKGLAVGGEPLEHGKLTGWAMDGFGIYAYQEEGGGVPVVDECGGHFGPVGSGGEEVVYHYHSRLIVPYHLACQGPALGKCAETQSGTSYCHPGCGGFDVCVQPGTDPVKLNAYISKWDSTWLEKYTVNPYNGGSTVGLSFSVALFILFVNLASE